MSSSFTANLHLEKPANGDDVDTWDVPVNGNADVIDQAIGGTTTLNATSASGTVTLSAAQYRSPMITITGTLTADVNYQLPSGVGGEKSVLNATTGAHTITFSSAGGGTTVTLQQGARSLVQSDGTNIVSGGASSGANYDITSLHGLSTPLSVDQGGTGVAAVGGTVYSNLAGVQTITGTKSFTGTSSTLAEILTNAAEVATVSATAATGTIAYYAASQSVLFFTANAAGNWTLNLTHSAGTTLNTALATGQSITLAFLVTQGSPAYYNNVVQVDGSTSGVTTKWLIQAPTGGFPSGIDVYTYTVLKTGSGTFTVLATQAPFA